MRNYIDKKLITRGVGIQTDRQTAGGQLVNLHGAKN